MTFDALTYLAGASQQNPIKLTPKDDPFKVKPFLIKSFKSAIKFLRDRFESDDIESPQNIATTKGAAKPRFK